MRRLLSAAVVLLALVALNSCAHSFATRLDDRTFQLEGPEVPGGSDAPNRRMAEQLCPHGYRVLQSNQFKADYQSQMQTNWTIRCL